MTTDETKKSKKFILCGNIDSFTYYCRHCYLKPYLDAFPIMRADKLRGLRINLEDVIFLESFNYNPERVEILQVIMTWHRLSK